MTPQQKLEKLARLSKADQPIEVFKRLETLDEQSQNTAQNIVELDQKLDTELTIVSESLTTLDTKKADKDEVARQIEEIELEPGPPGNDGKDYILTETDKQEIAEKIKVPTVEKVVEKTEVIREVPVVTEVAVADPPFIIRDKLESLEGDNRLDASAIKNLPEVTKVVNERILAANRSLYQLLDVNVSGITTNQFLQWNGTQWVPASVVSGVSSVSNSDGSLTISPTTGAVIASLNTAHANTWTADQTFGTNTKLIFRNSNTQIYSSSDNNLVINGFQIHFDPEADLVSESNSIELNSAPGHQMRFESVGGMSFLGSSFSFTGASWDFTSNFFGSTASLSNDFTFTPANDLILSPAGEVQISNANPILDFIDTTASEDDFRASVNTSAFTLSNITDSKTIISMASDWSVTIGNTAAIKLAPLTTNGFIKTSGGNGTLSIDTSAYITLASLSGTSPITYNSGTGAIGFDFSTNNTWTGTQYINVNSTAALKVENSAGNTNTFIVDTSNGRVAINSSISSSASLVVGPVGNLTNLANFTRSLSTRVANTIGTLFSETLNWTGAAVLTGVNGVSVTMTDARTLNSGASDTIHAFNASYSRTNAFAQGTSTTTLTQRANRYTIQDTGVYNNTSNNSTVNLAFYSALMNSFAPDIQVSGKTLTYNVFGVELAFNNFAPVLTSGSLTLNYKGFSDANPGTTTGTTLGASFYSKIGAFDTTWVLFNDSSAGGMYMGGDSLKSYWGTGTNSLGSFTGAVGDCYIDFTGSEMEIVSDNITSTDSMLLRAGTNGLKLNIGATQQAILTSNLLAFTSGVNVDMGGLFTKYNNIATEGYGVPAIVDHVALTGQTADIGATNFTNAQTAGLYRINYILQDTTADVTAGTLTLTISWTDDAGATTATASQVLTAAGRTSGVIYVQLASGNLTYATTHTGIFGSAVYGLYMTAERVN